MSSTIQVFDPAMCCSTGVCGSSVDPQLIRFAADLEWLQFSGVSVERFNLAQQPKAFVENAAAKQALEAQGESALPLILINGAVKSTGSYPSREQLAEWADVAVAASIFSQAVSELVAIGAAIASNCEPCFKFHYHKARKMRISREDVLCAVTVAHNVKDAPARSIRALAERYLRRDANETEQASLLEEAESSASNGCCGPEPSSTETKGPKCC